MNVIQPKDQSLIDDRDAMLRHTMRPDSSPWPIASEYPIVLDHRDTTASFCVLMDGVLAAHANFWPRPLVDATGSSVGRCALIGNVATAPRFRGQGTTRPLFDCFNRLAAEQAIDLVVLWAEPDLHPFYQKSGFRSYGREWRYTFHRKDLPAISAHPAGQFLPIDRPSTGFSSHFLTTLLDLRPRGTTIGRTPAEFDRLLTIPDTRLFVVGPMDHPSGYAVWGRGCDMRETIHEWGVSSPDMIPSLLASVMDATSTDTCMILAPGNLDAGWRKSLARFATRSETHELCMAKGSDEALERFRDLFIWGMDSI
jgi:predicted GNAT family N-acyltransferase